MDTDSSFEVSLIVPIFNVEDYLEECLASIEAQTIFERVQVILIDDGSSDDSFAIAEGFAKRHDNAQLIASANQGAGQARNTALERVSAPYVAFLDSDDVLPADSLEVRLAAMAPHVDVVVGDMQTFPTKTRWPWSAGVAGQDRVIDGVSDFPELVSNASPCNKLFRAEAFRSRKFAVDVHFEDAFAVVPILLEASRIALVGKVVYLYRKRASGGSIMDSLFTRERNYWDHLLLAEHVSALASVLPVGPRDAARTFIVRSMQGFVLRAPETLNESELTEYFERLCRLFKNYTAEEIVRSTHNLHHRIGFAAILDENFELFRNRWDYPLGIERLAIGSVVLAHSEMTEEAKRICAVVAPRLLVESARATHGNVLLSGRMDLPGVPTAAAERLKIRLASTGRALSSFAAVNVRTNATSMKPTTVIEWTAKIAPGTLADGSSVLDAHVMTETSAFTIRVRPALGLLRSTKVIALPNGRAQVVPTSGDRAALVVHRRGILSARATWALMQAVSDIVATQKKQPFGFTRLVRLVLRAVTGPKPLWLVGERNDTAQDNGYRLFTWLRENASDITPRYVLDRDSPAWSSMVDRRLVVARGGLRHKLALLRARVIISSQDIDAYMLPPTWDRNSFRRHLAYRLGQRRVFLQHGVTCQGVGPKLAREVTGVDLLLATNAPEVNYLRGSTRYFEEIVDTGFPRFDTLVRGSDPSTVLIMPTWRNYLVLPSYSEVGMDPGTFRGSRYETFYRSLLTDPRFEQILEKYRATATFAPHYEIAPQFHALEGISPRVNVVAGRDFHVQAALRDARVLMTDYSSVMFDAAYADIPVVQMPFDLEEYHAGHYPRGWFDNAGGEYWPVASNIEQALDALDQILSRGAEVQSPFKENIATLFPRRDQENTRRVYEAIKALR